MSKINFSHKVECKPEFDMQNNNVALAIYQNNLDEIEHLSKVVPVLKFSRENLCTVALEKLIQQEVCGGTEVKYKEKSCMKTGTILEYALLQGSNEAVAILFVMHLTCH